MAGRDRLIIGLGNPGPDYETTRHNIGFMVVDALAETAGIMFKEDGRAQALLGRGRIRGRPIGLAKPLTYMNRSGESVRHLLRRYALQPEELLVILDDINLGLGTLRMRPHGGDGGHNGLQDIIGILGTNRFPRLRLGIGSDFPHGRQSEYVLSPFSEEEQSQLAEMILRARDAAISFVCDGVVTAMNRFNG